MQILIVEAVLLIFLILATVCIIINRDLLSSVVVYCGFSFCAALLYLVMGAPDVAFTEAVIGTVSTVYFVIVIKSIRKKRGTDEEDR